MPITVPAPQTKIMAESFGIPVATEVNRLTPLVDAMAKTTWTNIPTLSNGWTHSTVPAQYRKVGDIVYLRGHLLSGNVAGGVIMATLPAGFRHLNANNMHFVVGYYSGGWKYGDIDIDLNGNLKVGATAFSTDAQPLTLNNVFYSTLA